MLRIIMLLAILTGCGTDSYTTNEITPPQPQEYETLIKCWTEIKCYRSKRTCKRKCREVEVCEEKIIPVGI